MWLWVARGILRPGVRGPTWGCAQAVGRTGGFLRGSAQRSSSGGGGEREAEAGLEETIRAEKRKLKAIKLRRIQIELGLSGPPPRSLTTEAMEQIRFLRTKFPEEWSVSQLAEGFSVSEDAIRRVLRSKFKPSLQRRMKQDASVCGARQTVPQLTASPPSGKALVESKLITAREPLPRLSQGTTTALPPQSVSNGRLHNRIAKETGRISRTQQNKKLGVQSSPDMVKAREREECSSPDTQHPPGVQETDEELQELAANQLKVVQKGSEFYDCEGNFLYRIHNVDSLNNPKQET
ncbi:neugrin [Mustelus asterias]